MSAPRRIALIASCSGQGKSTLGRELAARLGVTLVELDAWVHGPNWTETPDAELLARLEPVLHLDGWVIDGTYEDKLGTRVLKSAEVVVWMDLPMRIWLPRLTRRTLRRVALRQELWNGNRERLRDAIWGRDSLYGYAFQTFYRRRRDWPEAMSMFPTVRLRSRAEVDRFLDGFSVR